MAMTSTKRTLAAVANVAAQTHSQPLPRVAFFSSYLVVREGLADCSRSDGGSENQGFFEERPHVPVISDHPIGHSKKSIPQVSMIAACVAWSEHEG
jgi:hypothetical protein